MHKEQMTGSEAEEAVAKALRALGVVLRRSVHLYFARKIDFRIDAYALPPSAEGGEPGERRRRVLCEPIAVQYTKDWNNPNKIREYRDLVFRERAGRERRLYVQVHGSVTPEAAAKHLLLWVERLQTQSQKDRLEGLEILPEGASMFYLRDRLEKLEVVKSKRRAHAQFDRLLSKLDQVGIIAEVKYIRIHVRQEKPSKDEDEFMVRYQIGSVSVLPEGGGKAVHFQRYQMTDRRLLNHLSDVADARRDRFKDKMVAYSLADSADDPFDLTVLIG